MKGLILIAAVVLTCCLKDFAAADPSILVTMKFEISWKEMCLLKDYLKENVVKQIVTKTGTLDTDRLVLYNFEKSCLEPSADHANVEMFVTETRNGSAANIDEPMTKKLYTVLHYLYEQKQERYIGNLFVGKIKDVTVSGKNAPTKSTAYTEIERLYIGIGVACAILALIVIILVAVSCYKNRNNKKEDRYSNRAAYQADKQEVRTYPAENRGFDQEGNDVQNSDYRVTTRF